MKKIIAMSPKIPTLSKDDSWIEISHLKLMICNAPLLRILTVGEADFSFSWALIQAQPRCAMMATRYESIPPDASIYKKLESNLKLLELTNVSVAHGVDATKLDVNQSQFQEFWTRHKMNGCRGFEKIYFNFPYTEDGCKRSFGDQCKKIQRLVAEFVGSAIPLLSPSGQILMGKLGSREDYYTPDDTDPMIPSHSETKWDQWGWLKKYGYEHRKSVQDEPHSDFPEDAVLRRYYFLKTVQPTFFTMFEGVSDGMATQIMGICREKKYITIDSEVNVESILKYQLTQTPLTEFMGHFSKFGRRIACQIVAALIRLASARVSEGIEITRNCSRSYATSRLNYTTYIAPHLKYLDARQFMDFMKIVLSNRQMWAGVIDTFEEYQHYRVDIIGEINQRAFGSVIEDLLKNEPDKLAILKDYGLIVTEIQPTINV